MAQRVTFHDALDIVASHAARLQASASEKVGLLATSGRVLAHNVLADRDQPPFDRATRDGFAVRAKEWTDGRRLQVVGQLRAGEAWVGEPLAPGTAAEIMTGAPLIPGADAIAMVEHAQEADGLVWSAARRPLGQGDHIVRRGSEASRGSVILPAGALIGAAEIAEAATCGYAELAVRAKPRVAVVATGDELVGLADTPGPHQIRNSNTYALSALVEAAGGVAERLDIARDSRTDLHERIAHGRLSDLLLLSGGVSAGKYDLVEEVLSNMGAEFFFTGVKMQPGKPLVFGRLPVQQTPKERECYFFGLPGNPISTQVTFHCFVEPFLRVMSGGAWNGPKFAQATLAEDVPSKTGLTRVLPALLISDLIQPTVRLVTWQGSGDLAANARANCYAVLPDGKQLQAGDTLTILLR